MRNILLTISYDGTDFCGWQRQDVHSTEKKVRTVQDTIEEALKKIHGEHSTLYGSGRTDSGVHAIGQVANFFSPIDSIPVEKYNLIINNLLPKDIRIISANCVDNTFNARYNATSRVYRYFIYIDKTPPANITRYAWHINHTPNIQKLNNYLTCLKGEIDCSSFVASGDKSVSTFRYIESARFFLQDVFPQGKCLVFEIEANAFLWKMVRTITGTLLQLERENANDNALQEILMAKNRTKAGITAPPVGLFLWQVKFDGIRRHI